MYYLYFIYNHVNGKLYVGYTKNPKQRWLRHKSTSRGKLKNRYAIHWALAKYGVDNFTFKVVEVVAGLEYAKNREIEWIRMLKEYKHQLYNETNGGDGGLGLLWTPEHKQYMSELMSGSNNPMYRIQLFGAANGNFGKKMKPHVKETLLKARRKLTDEQILEIKSLFADNNYTQTQLSKQFNVSLTQIHRIVRNKSWGDKDHDSIITKKNLTKKDIIDIRSMYATNNYTQKEIAVKYNCSLTHINKIINDKKWKNI